VDPIAKFCHGREGDAGMGVRYCTIHQCLVESMDDVWRLICTRVSEFWGGSAGRTLSIGSVQGAWITALARWIVWNVIMIPGLGL